jgi:hypothetical protein
MPPQVSEGHSTIIPLQFQSDELPTNATLYNYHFCTLLVSPIRFN